MYGRHFGDCVGKQGYKSLCSVLLYYFIQWFVYVKIYFVTDISYDVLCVWENLLKYLVVGYECSLKNLLGRRVETCLYVVVFLHVRVMEGFLTKKKLFFWEFYNSKVHMEKNILTSYGFVWWRVLSRFFVCT